MEQETLQTYEEVIKSPKSKNPSSLDAAKRNNVMFG